MKSGTFKRILSLLLVVAMSFSVFATPVAYALEGDEPNTEISSEQKEEISSEQKEEISSEQKEEKTEGEETASQMGLLGMSTMALMDEGPSPQAEGLELELEGGVVTAEALASIKAYLGVADDVTIGTQNTKNALAVGAVLKAGSHKFGTANKSGFSKGYYNTGVKSVVIVVPAELTISVEGNPEPVEVSLNGEVVDVTDTVQVKDKGEAFVLTATEIEDYVYEIKRGGAVVANGSFKVADGTTYTVAYRVDNRATVAVSMAEGGSYTVKVGGKNVTDRVEADSEVVVAVTPADKTWKLLNIAVVDGEGGPVTTTSAGNNAVKFTAQEFGSYTVSVSMGHIVVAAENLVADLEKVRDGKYADVVDALKAQILDQVQRTPDAASMPQAVTISKVEYVYGTLTLPLVGTFKAYGEIGADNGKGSKAFGYTDGALVDGNTDELRITYSIEALGIKNATLDATVTVKDNRAPLAIVLPERPFTIIYEAPHEGHSTLYNRVLNNMSVIEGTDRLNVEKLTVKLDEEYPEVSLLGTTVTLTVVADTTDTFATTSKEFKVIVLPHASSLDVKNTTWVYGDAENSVDKLSKIITTDPVDLDYLAIATGVNYAPGGYASLVVPKSVREAMRIDLTIADNDLMNIGIAALIAGMKEAAGSEITQGAIDTVSGLLGAIGITLPTDLVKTLIRTAGAFETTGSLLTGYHNSLDLYKALELLVGDGIQVGDILDTIESLSDILVPLLKVVGDISGSEQVSAVLNGITSLIESINLNVNLLLTLDKAPTEAGIYTVAAISVNPNYAISSDVGLLHIVPQSNLNSDVKLEFKEKLPVTRVLSWSKAQEFDFTAQQVKVFYDKDGNRIGDEPIGKKEDVKTLFTGMEFDGDGVAKNVIPKGENAPRNPGFYTQTAMVAEGNYWNTPISRTYTIQRQTVKLELSDFATYVDDENVVPTLTVTTESNTEADAATVTGKTTVYYTGRTADGRLYSSSTAPTVAGTYTVTATFAGDSMFQPAMASARYTLKKHGIIMNMDNDTVTYDGEPHALEATVAFEDGFEPEVAPVVSYMYEGKSNNGNYYVSNQAPTDAGKYTVTAKVAGTAAYEGAVVVATLTIKKADYVIEAADKTVVYNTMPQAIEAPVVSPEATVNVIYKGTSANGNAYYGYEPTDAGVYTAYITVKGDANHNSASATQTLTIEKAKYHIELEADKTVTYNGEAHAMEAKVVIDGTYSEDPAEDEVIKEKLVKEIKGAVVYRSNKPYYNSTTAPTNAGEYTATAEFKGTYSNFEAAEYPVSILTIKKADYVLTAEDKTVIYNTMPQAIDAPSVTPNHKINVIYEGTSYNGNYYYGYEPTDAGVYTAHITVKGNMNYNDLEETRTLTIKKVNYKVTMANVTEDYNGEAHVLVPVVTILDTFSEDEAEDEAIKEKLLDEIKGTVYYSSLVPLYGSTNGPVNAGTYMGQVQFKGERSNFNDANRPTTAWLTINRAVVDVELDDNSLNVEYDGNPHGIDVTASADVDYSVLYVGNSFNGNYYVGFDAPTDAGVYKVTVEYAGDWNHKPFRKDYELVIRPRAATITIHNKSKLVGTQDPALSCTVDNLVEGESLAFELYREEGEAVGVYPIRANVKETGNNRNYLITIVGEGMGVPRGINDDGYALFTIYAPDQFVSPKTGDASNMALYIAVLCMSVLGIAGLAVVSKRKHN